MFESDKICPYTGLRPFTEEESIYFKGRDEHIDQATRQLEKNKFIMLTGASGDGKSSLVYAGIIPNARAGFLKSQFSNWIVADFRPERTPLENLSQSLAKRLGITNVDTVRTELSHGFSSLVDIYKASKYYHEVHDFEWMLLDDKAKSARKREAANLIIIADQFEEFFTNPENFQHGIPSQEATLVTSLLLETARISQEEKLPIYVIITMRSDFIGQCSSFRGLPEAIGFSQFFVPRLNRGQLQEVIEEPAALSGNRISRRLTERLIHDMVEGTDQLPILQHALNQIWKMADEGKAEMDLIHYAMVGGMRGTDLPGQEAHAFGNWFGEQPVKIQKYYENPDLQNVLNTHANKLYSVATDYIHAKYNERISEFDVQQIIETAFKCLTKIDNGRAVRNRMALGDIAAILNKPAINDTIIGHVLDIFRQPGNTLLRPFKEEVNELTAESVLDITHESLIRNWDNLDRWAKDEFASYTTYLDFSQQLNRWVDSGKSNAFLLYIGPLTFFEDWYIKAKPNITWISRYLSEGLSKEKKVEKARTTLDNIQEFLPRSAKKHRITRAVIRYGPRKISLVIGIIFLITLSSFMMKNYISRRNEGVMKSISEDAIPLLNNPKVYYERKALFINEQLRLKLTTVKEAISQVKDPVLQLQVANGIAASQVFYGRTEPGDLIHEALMATDSLLNVFPLASSNVAQLSGYINVLKEWRATIGLAHYYNPSDELLALQKKDGKRCAELVIHILDKKPAGFQNSIDFMMAVQTAITFDGFTADELQRVITMMSPFNDGKRSEWAEKYFAQNNFVIMGYQGYGFPFNGIYELMAGVYAYQGKVDMSLQAIDTLLKYNQGYYQGEYASVADNASNIAAVFYLSGHADRLDAFVSGYCKRHKTSEIDFYQRLIGRSRPINLARNSSIQAIFPEAHNLNLIYGDQKELTFFFEKYRKVIAREGKSDDEKNFLTAISYKDEGIFRAHRSQVVGLPFDRSSVYSLFKKATDYYNLVKPAYLRESIEIIAYSSAEEVNTPRQHMFVFPDIITAFPPMSPRDYHFSYMSSSFVEYLIDEGLFATLFNGPEQWGYLEEWLVAYHYNMLGGAVTMRNDITTTSLTKLATALEKLDASPRMNMNLVYLYLGSRAYAAGNNALALESYNKLHLETLSAVLVYQIFGVSIQSRSVLLIGKAFTCFIQNGKVAEANKLLEIFKKPANKASIYSYAAMVLSDSNVQKSTIRQLIDSASAETGRVEDSNPQQPNKNRLAQALLSVAITEANIARAKELIKNQPVKLVALEALTRTMSYRQRAFESTQFMPKKIGASDQLDFLRNVLTGYANSGPPDARWKEYNRQILHLDLTYFIPYVNEND